MKRPWYLTVLLILFFIGIVFQIIGLATDPQTTAQLVPNAPSWIVPILLLLSIVDLVALAMLWMWKIMGFYLTIAVTVVMSLLFFAFQGAGSLGTIFFGAIGIGVLYLAMKPVWSNFK
ncbi:MAG: hypothetical protein ACD_50C00197G0008 [uncultured bacterium]|nr:MAG: hypothetical protein ACD_50C00197G0008 [uncultured bacterium]OGH13912.1 MAG: hypothetical protein A2687_03765 [Candidatus Levybacteria bacterium RIFCSPHIGHO2_01_FULL_38_26]